MPAAQWPGTVFTLNNYTDDDYDRLLALDTRYTVVAKEVGSNGTPHLQGYIEVENKKAFGGWKRFLGEASHFEKRQGSPKQAAGYCMKGEVDPTDYDDFSFFFDNPHPTAVFQQRGELPSQGARQDLADHRDEIKNGTSVDELTMRNPNLYHQYGRTLQKVEDIVQRTRLLATGFMAQQALASQPVPSRVSPPTPITSGSYRKTGRMGTPAKRRLSSTTLGVKSSIMTSSIWLTSTPTISSAEAARLRRSLPNTSLSPRPLRQNRFTTAGLKKILCNSFSAASIRFTLAPTLVGRLAPSTTTWGNLTKRCFEQAAQRPARNCY